ncbi:MAG: tandem-95 repeat protein [Candidatus Magnetomorum sp.]|nr:tandem-95 repeat protein [Candidatus Magnetomorum sp.]
MIRVTRANEFGNYSFSQINTTESLIIGVSPPQSNHSYQWQSFEITDITPETQNHRFDIFMAALSSKGICGHVFDGNNGLSGIAVNIVSIANNYQNNAITDETGYYEIKGLPQGSDYVVSIDHTTSNTRIYYALPESLTPGVMPSCSVFLENQATKIQPSDPLLENITILIDTGGTISGCLKWDNQQAISGILVSAWSDSFAFGNSAISNENGWYTITGLLPVTEDMAAANGYHVEIISDALPSIKYEEGVLLPTHRNDIHFVIDNQIAISGHVSDSKGYARENVSVVAWSASAQSRSGTAVTDMNGNYTILNLLSADDYLVAVFPDDLPIQYYNQVSDSKKASTLVIDHSMVRDIDFVLYQKSRIYGKVYLNDTTASGLRIDIVSFSQSYRASVQTDKAGNYEFIGLDPTVSDYVIYLEYPGMETFQSLKLKPSEEAFPINLQKGLTVRGSVFANNTTLDNASILLISGNGLKYFSQSNLSSPFNYTVTGLVQENYRIEVIHDTHENQVLESLSLYADMDNLDFYLEQPTRNMSGIILGLNQGHTVRLNAWSDNRHTTNFINITGTGDSVSFEIPDLISSNDYRLEIISQVYEYQAHDRQSQWENADLIDLSNNDVTDIIIQLKSLIEKPVITGIIHFSEIPIPGQKLVIEAQSQKLDLAFQTEMLIPRETTSLSLAYTLLGLSPSDDYMVSVKSLNYIDMFYPNAIFLKNAGQLMVSTDQSQSNIDFTLQKGRRISGIITDSNMAGIDNIDISAWSVETGASAHTRSTDGYYVIDGLPPLSDYLLTARIPEKGLFYYHPEGAVRTIDKASPVSVLTENQNQIDMTIERLTCVSGKVMDISGNGIENMWVEIFSERYQAGSVLFSDPDGQFNICGLPDSQDYQISVKPEANSLWLPLIQSGIHYLESVHLILSQKQMDLFTISGIVTNINKHPVEPAKITLKSLSDKDFYIHTTSRKNGSFEWQDIPKGNDYIISVYPSEMDNYALFCSEPFALSRNYQSNIVLNASLSISGHIYEYETNTPIPDARVILYASTRNFHAETQSDSTGQYRFNQLENANDYVVVVHHENYITVRKKQLAPDNNLNFILRMAARVCGQVKDKVTGQEIPDVPVEIYSSTRQNMDGYYGSVVSDQSGRFCLAGLMPSDSQGHPIENYMATATAPGFPPMSISIRQLDRPANFFVFKGKENEISGNIQNASHYDYYIDVVDIDYGFQVTLPATSDGNFVLDGLLPERGYTLIFLAFDTNGTQVYKQWAVYNPESGMDTGGDENSATVYHTGNVLKFQFNTDIKRRRDVKEEAAESVDTVDATTPIVQLSSNDLSVTSSVRDIVSRDSVITVEWFTEKEVQGFYHAFNQQKDYHLTKRTVAKVRPSKLNKAQSKTVVADNEYYYFHVASVTDRGRIGATTTAAFRIDNVAPKNLLVDVPILSDSRDIDIQLGASGANEVYISNSGFDHGGKWKLLERKRLWKLLPGNGLKPIYVRFRDQAYNIARTLSSIEYKESVKQYTIETSFDNHGTVDIIFPDTLSEQSNKRTKENEYSVPEGTQVQMVVHPNEGYVIDEVFVNDKRVPVIDNQYTFEKINQHQYLRVTFKPIEHIITAISGVYGRIEPSGEIFVNHGDNQEFTFTPLDGTRLAQLIVDGKVIENDTHFTFETVDKNHTIMAIFVRVFQIDASHGDNGVVSPDGIINIDQDGYQNFSFIPDWGYEIDTVTINDDILPTRPNTYSCLNVSRNQELYVTFKRVEFMIAATSNQGGSIAPSGNIAVDMGGNQTFTFTPDFGYALSAVIVDGVKQPLDQQSYAFEGIDSNHSISVSYKPIEFHIYTTSNSGGSVYPSGAVTVIKGRDQSFTIQPSSGYDIEAVYLDDEMIPHHDNTVVIPSVMSDHNLHVVFEQIHIFSAIAGPNGQITPNGSIAVVHGDTQEFLFTPDDGYTINTITVDSQVFPYTYNMLYFKNVQSDHTIMVSYTPICHIIESKAGDNGRIEPQGMVSVNEGHSQTFTIIPDHGFETLSLLIDSQPVVVTQNHYTFTDVRDAHEIQVTFKLSNQAPLVSNMDISLLEDHVYTGNLQAQDSDNNPLTFTMIQAPQLGYLILSDQSTGEFTYTPTVNLNGSDYFTFKVSDGIVDSATARVDIWITPVNDIPVALAYALTLNEDSSVQQKLSAWDAENDQLSFSIVSQPQNGDVVLNGTTVTYYPGSNFYGKDRIIYQVSDEVSQSSSIPISLTILPVNDPPIVENQYYRTGTNSSVDIVLSVSDVDSGSMIWTVSSPQSGKLEGTAPELIYTPETDFEGEDFFVVLANDGLDESLPATITLFIGATDVYTMEDTPVSIKEQLEVFGDPEHVHINKTPVHGSLSGNMPDITYSPNPDFFGDDIIWLTIDEDSQSKKIAIYVGPVNDTPVLSLPESIQITEDSMKAITIVIFDIENDALKFDISEWSHGHIVSDRLPVVEFYPEKDYFGEDMIIIQLSDDSSSVSKGVQLITKGVNDFPVAYHRSIATMEDMPIEIILQASDIDSSHLNYQYTQTTYGTISGEPPVLLYTPDNNWFGTDQLVFQVNDGELKSLVATVDIRVKAVNDPPEVYSRTVDLDEDAVVTFTVNGFDPDDDPFTFQITDQSQQGSIDILNAATGKFQYTPKKDFYGTDSFKVKTTDGTVDSQETIIYLTIAPVNDPPVLVDCAFNTFEDHRMTYTLVAVDQDSDALSYSVVFQAVKGTVSLNQKTGVLIYSPFPDVNGNDGFTVVADDGLSQSQIALVSVWITPVNDPPVAIESRVETTEDQWIESTLNAQDNDSISLTFQVVQAAKKGCVDILDAGTGLYRYTPDMNANGFDSFIYWVSDGNAASCTGVATIQIMPENDAPFAMNDLFLTFEDQSFSGQLTAIDVDKDNLIFTVITNSTKGALTLTNPSTGQFVYIPYANENGSDHLSFQVTDGELFSNTASINISIIPKNDPPEVISQLLETSENKPLSIELSGNDIDNDTFYFDIISFPEHGTLNGTNANWVYIPSTDYWGMDQFEFVADDQNSQSDRGTIQIRVGVPEADIYAGEDQSVNIAAALGFTPIIVSFPENGTLKQMIYTPDSNYNGFDRIGYTYQTDNIQEAIIYIKPLNDPPQILYTTPDHLELNEDTVKKLNIDVIDVDHEINELICRIIQSPAHGQLVIDQMAVSYYPVTHYFGSDIFIYQISDGLSQVNKQVSINVLPVNDIPMAKNISLEMMEDQSIDINFAATDIEQQALSYTIIDYPDHGMMIEKKYWPDADYWGWDRLTYVANDGISDSNAATISIHVRNVNDAPIARWDVIKTYANSSVIGQLVVNDVDYQDTLTFKILESSTKGQFQMNERNGVFSFWAYETATGLDWLTFLVNDGTVNSTIGGITIVIQSEPPNIAPVANDSSLMTYKNVKLNGRLKAVDSNQDRLMFMISKYPTKGIFILNNPDTGAFTYYPDRDITGTDFIEFYVNDGQTDSNSAILQINIEESIRNQPIFYDLSVQVTGPEKYTYSLMNQQGEVVVDNTLQYSDIFIERLPTGNYRLIILSKDYLPFEYYEESPYINLDQDRSLLVTLTESPGFDPFKPTVDVSHKNHSQGFDLQVIQHNANSFVWTVNGQPLSLSDYTGNGTSESPYQYLWQTGMANTWQDNTPRIGDKTVELQFNFYDGIEWIDKYNVSYIQYGSEDSEEQDKPVEQKVFEEGGLYNSKAISTTKNKTAFYPLMGTTFHLRVTDPSQKERELGIIIPPLPLEYLLCNDPLKRTDELTIQTSYYTFGPNALATGINLKLFKTNGQYVSLNPSSNRKSDAPVIGLPVLINTNVYQAGKFKAMVCETDSTQFESTSLPIVDHGNGYLEIQTNHLSGFGVELVKEEESDDSGGNCFIEVLSGTF